MIPTTSDFMCCICKEDLRSVSSLHSHQISSHTIEELSLAILLVNGLQFGDMVRYPHFILNKSTEAEPEIARTENETETINNCSDPMLICGDNSVTSRSNYSPTRISQINAVISRIPNIIEHDAQHVSYVLPSPISHHHRSSIAYDYGKDGSFESIQCGDVLPLHIALGTCEKETQTGIISVATKRLAAFRKKKGLLPPESPPTNVAMVDVGEQRFMCELCKKSYKKKSHLERHIRIHTGKRPFQCPHCKKTFTVGSILKQHIRTHTGEKPFTCNICERKFPQKSGLMHHMWRHKRLPFKCIACNMTFVSNKKLMFHMKSHSGSKTVSCTICGIEFYTIAALRQHAQIHVSE
ncbi:hypothetical protein C0J52_11614 [Blattella germanica]|nr:hypothetical protein C0J52_11614 [Blattella germanica]